MTRVPKHEIEALLFSSGKAMSVDQLVTLSKLDKAKVQRALKALKKEYAERESAVVVEQDGPEWKMTVRNDYLLLVKNIVADTELPRAVMETLAVVAYKYPKVLQSEVVDTRGSGAYEHIQELEKLGFVRKEKEGRSFALKLTEKFFEYFEVTGEKDIRAAFKGVRKPERQEKLAGMDVVDVPEEEKEKQQPLEGMDVVDVQAAKPKAEKPKEPEFDEAHQEFLDDLDKRISAIGQQNDAHDEDPQLQRMVPEEEPEEGSPLEEKDN